MAAWPGGVLGSHSREGWGYGRNERESDGCCWVTRMFQVGCPVQAQGWTRVAFPAVGKSPGRVFLYPLPPVTRRLVPCLTFVPWQTHGKARWEGGQGTRAPLHLPERCG